MLSDLAASVAALLAGLVVTTTGWLPIDPLLSLLVAALILTELGMTGAAAVARVRERRPGALYNETFADYIASRDTEKTSA